MAALTGDRSDVGAAGDTTRKSFMGQTVLPQLNNFKVLKLFAVGSPTLVWGASLCSLPPKKICDIEQSQT